MNKAPWKTLLIVLALFLALPAAATAQAGKISDTHPSNSKNAKAVRPATKTSLQSVTLVSTDELARKVAEEESSKSQAPKAGEKHSKGADTSKGTDGAVLEFRPTDSPPAADSSNGTFQVKDGKKKSVLKNIHGRAYGAAASGIGGANGEGGAVGADSRGGKFNVYVEGEHAHDNTPNPH